MRRNSTLFRYGSYLASVGTARLLGILITSVTFPYLVRKLGLEMYGLWSYVIAICVFLDIIANPGVAVYAVQQVAARREEAFDMVSDTLALRILGSFLAAFVVAVVAHWDNRVDVRHLLLLYGLGLFAVNLTAADYLLGALELFHARSMLSVMQQAIYALGVFTLVRKPGDVMWLPISILISTLISNIGGWIVLRKSGLHLSARFRPERWRAILGPSLHYGVSTLMSNFYHRTGHIVVRWFLGEHALGLYSVSVRLVDILRNIVVMVLTIFMPRMALSARSEGGMARISRAAVSVVALANIPLMLGTIATARLVVPLILGAQYRDAVSLVQWMAPYVITATAASLFTGSMLYAMGEHRAYFASTASGAVVGVLLYLTLTPTFGVFGAGSAFVLGELAVALVAFFSLPAELHDLWKNRMIAVAVGAGLLMLFAVEIIMGSTSSLVLVVSLGVGVYLLASGWFVKRWLIDEYGGLG